MKSPWKSFAPLESDREYVVLVSSIPALKWSSTRRLFKGASAVREQLAGTEGARGIFAPGPTGDEAVRDAVRLGGRGRTRGVRGCEPAS